MGIGLLMLCYCNTADKEAPRYTLNVDIADKKDFNMNSIADFNSAVQLEVTDKSYIKQINQVYLLDSFIVVWDFPMNSILVFNKRGKYLYTLGSKGQGPEEYIGIESVYVDYNKRHLLLMDNSKQTVITYDVYGNFIGADKLLHYAYSFYPGKKGYWLLDYGQNKSKYNLILINRESKKLVKGFLPTSNNLPLISSNNFCEVEIGNVIFHFPYQNIIYTLEEDELRPFLKIDFGKSQNPYTDMKSGKFHDFIKTNDYIGGIHNLYMHGDHLFFSFYKNFGIGKSIKTYNVHISMPDSAVSIYDYGCHHSELPVAPLPSIIGMSCGKLIYQIDPSVLNETLIDKINDSDLMRKTGISGVTTESNPILIIYDLKK